MNGTNSAKQHLVNLEWTCLWTSKPRKENSDHPKGENPWWGILGVWRILTPKQTCAPFGRRTWSVRRRDPAPPVHLRQARPSPEPVEGGDARILRGEDRLAGESGTQAVSPNHWTDLGFSQQRRLRNRPQTWSSYQGGEFDSHSFGG